MEHEVKITPSELAVDIQNLNVQFEVDDEIVRAVNGVDIKLKRGKVLGLVGETGAGKTTTALSSMRLVQCPPGVVTADKIEVDGIDMLAASHRELEQIRGSAIAMIFQDPMTSLNPVFPVGEQIAESIRIHQGCSAVEAMKKAEEMLVTVGIPRERAYEYPHQFSGGMKQRAVIAIALSCNPKVLLADEPTTALDVTIQAQVLDMMMRLKQQYDMSMIFITHDLGIIAEICDEVAVMYAGKIIEQGTLEEVFNHTKHPYTEGLFNSLPDIENREHKLKPIPGMMPDPTRLPKGCAFAPRCPYAKPECIDMEQKEIFFSDTHKVLCCAYQDPSFHIERKEID